MNHRETFYFNKGCRLFAERHFAEAESELRICLGMCPGDAEVLNALGTVLDAQERYDEALLFYREAISRDSSNPAYYCNFGNVLRQSGEVIAAEAAYNAALAIDPSFTNALLSLGNLYLECNRLGDARPILEKMVWLQPDSADGWYDLGHVALRQGCYAEAEHCFSVAHTIDPDNSAVSNSLGVSLLRMNRYEDAREIFIKILDANPESSDALCNLAVYYHWSGSVDRAIACYEKLLDLFPDHAEGNFNHAIALLAAGRFLDGWTKYEWRFRSSGPIAERHAEFPRWRGESLAGRSILIHCEQGYGDSIQFIRYARLLKDEGATVYVEAKDRLISGLLGTAPGVSKVFPREETAPPVDFQIPIMSLPFALGERSWPPPLPPYLQIPETMTEQWRSRLSSHAGLKVGLAWAGNKEHGNNYNRSIVPTLLTPLGDVQGITLVSLQFGCSTVESPSIPLLDFTGEVSDFLTSAALVSSLDLVITIDSAIAHLAGALGIPVWLMLPYNNDWRWMRNRSDSPWYPTTRLFRQTIPGRWEPVIADVSVNLINITG